MGLSHNSQIADREPAWGGVDKSALPREAFAETGEADKKSSWGYPHHWVSGGKMYLHRGGLNAAWGAAQGARSGDKAAAAVIAHLRAHRKAVGLDARLLMRDVPQDPWAPISARRFKKDVIRTGTFVLSDGRELDVTRARMDEWTNKFKQMKAAGIRVPFPVDHSGRSTDNQGWVEDLYREGNRLFAEIEVPLEEDARRIGATIKEVSVRVDPDFRDGTGREWGEVVSHVAPCTNPVVPGQGDFVALDAREGEDGEVILCTRKESGMDWTKEVTRLLDLQGEPDEAAVFEALKKRLGDHAATLRQAKAERDAAVAQLAPLRQEKADLELKLKETAGKDKDEDPAHVEMRRELDAMALEGAEERAAALLRDGRITPAMKDDVVALLSRRGFSLALKSGTEEIRKVVGRLFAALPRGAALDLSERTKLAQETDNPNDSDNRSEADLRKAGQGLAARVQPRPTRQSAD